LSGEPCSKSSCTHTTCSKSTVSVQLIFQHKRHSINSVCNSKLLNSFSGLQWYLLMKQASSGMQWLYTTITCEEKKSSHYCSI
jgi:hypothetical protein